MAPNDSDVEIFYGVRAILPPPLRVRVPHRQQSADVRRLLTELSARVPAPGAATKERGSLSHSRRVAAAAIARHGRVGIDVEYMCPRRDSHAILEVFLGPLDKPVSLATFYRAWTFGEAYFKAFGRLPGAESLGRVIEHHTEDGLYRVDHLETAAFGVLHSNPFDDFALTIVWEIADIASAKIQPPTCLLDNGFDGAGNVRLAAAPRPR